MILGEIIILAWFFVIGSVLGSFLNVVIYRVPRRLSLVYPPSRCPVCLHPIRWHDNIPILSWLLLRGRCRDCGSPIPRTYPIVEAVAGLNVLIIALKGGGGHWVPILDALLQRGLLSPALVETVVFVAISLSLLAAARMLYDRQRVPILFWVVPIVFGVFGPSIAWVGPGNSPPDSPSVGAPVTNWKTPRRATQSAATREKNLTNFPGSAWKPLLSLAFGLATGVVLDLSFRSIRLACPEEDKPRKGTTANLPTNSRTRNTSPHPGHAVENAKPLARHSASGWEYSFACTICGLTLGNPVQMGFLMLSVALIAGVSFAVSKRRLTSGTEAKKPLSLPVATEGKQILGANLALRFRSVPMFSLWLLFLVCAVVR